MARTDTGRDTGGTGEGRMTPLPTPSRKTTEGGGE